MSGLKYRTSIRYGRVLLLQRKDNGFWYAKYRLPDSPKWVEKTLKTRLIKDAKKLADHLNVQIINKTMGIADGTVLLEILFGKFIEAKDGRVKPKTLERLKTTISSFRQWLSAHHPDIRLARHVTAEIVRQFQSDRKGDGLSLRSVNNDIMNLHTVFRWAVREGLMSRSPADYSKNGTVDRFKVPRLPPAVYTQKEVDALIAAAEAGNDTLTRDLIVVFAGTGMRFEELAHLKPSNILWGSPVPKIEVRAQKDWSPKDPFEEKRIPMLPEVQEVFRRRCSVCRSDDEYIFKNQAGGKIFVNRSRERLQKLFPKAGINGGRRLHQHSFRNYFIIRCLKNGVIVNAIMQWTGHDSAAMVLHYAQAMNPADEEAEFSKLTRA